MLQKRLQFCLGIIFFLLAVLAARLVHVQLISSLEYSKKAQGQFLKKNEIESNRGDILDRNGVELATTIESFSIYAHPREIDFSQNLEVLKEVCPNYKKLLKTKRKFIWLKRKLDAKQVDPIRQEHLTGIGIFKEQKRYYPNGEMAAQVLGSVGIDNKGLSGLERSFNEELKGKTFVITQIRDGKGRKTVANFDPANLKWDIKKKVKNSIYLTINRALQHVAETEIKDAVEHFKAKQGSVILQNPKTGEILAMASYPSFDPNSLAQERPKNFRNLDLQNQTIEHIYEPGSTFKIVAFSAALEEEKITPDQFIFCENGDWKYSSVTIHDHEPEGRISVRRVMEVSSNIGTGKIALMLGANTFYNYVQAFGFGFKTGIALPSETDGLVRPLQQWSTLSLPILSFGQEIGVTPLQLIGAFSCLANDGVLMEPMIVKKIMESTPTQVQTKTFEPQQVRRVVSKKTAETMRSILRGVVTNGTATKAEVLGYSVAGKTGTAQKIDPKTRKYSTKNYVASFCGFLPAQNPEIVCLVVLDEPQSDYWGGSTTAPVFSKIMSRSVNILGIMPEKSLRLETKK